MNTSLKLIALGALAYGAMDAQQARAQGVPPSGPSDIGRPSSGSILQSNPILTTPVEPRTNKAPTIESQRPAAPGESSAAEERVHVSRIEVDNAPPALKKKVDAVVAPYRDRDMTLTEVRNVSVLVTEVLLDHGETISYAYVPQQDIVDDVVHLRVLRGHIEAIKLKQNHSLVRDRVLQSFLDRGVDSTGDVKFAQEQLTRLSELPGIGATSPVLSPGLTPGGTILTVNAEPSPRVEGAMVMDNAGSELSGRNRIGAQINVNSPLGLGDRFQAVFYGAPDALQFNHDSESGYTVIGRVSYDLPIGRRGARAGVAVSRVNYLLGGPIYSGYGNGMATVYSVYGSYPIARARSYNLDVSATLDYKQMTDSFFGDANRRSAPVLGFQLSGDKQGQIAGRPNILEYQIGVSGGDLHNYADWNGLRTRGTYLKTTQFAKLSQGLARGVYFDLSVNAQQASKNLDGSEKMVLGGPNAVRAYSNDTASVDSGYAASATLSVAVPKANGLMAQLFYDRAQGRVQKFTRGKAVTVNISGAGAGLNYVIDKRASVNLSYAMRIGSNPVLGADQHKGMVWASTVIRF